MVGIKGNLHNKNLNPFCLRSWIYVDDCAEAIRLVTEMIHNKVQKLMNREATKIQFAPIADRPYHDRRYLINFNKIREELGWKCLVPFEQGLTKTLAYYLKEYNKLQRELTTLERPHG
ncbi:unnamed protein product [Meloidogyne enterolobii]|uniref:Uncharacterized protein n=1 Tax=Meloidogyne enterolobii TaxID=390850 RepID=A0ACB0XUM6_MELEN